MKKIFNNLFVLALLVSQLAIAQSKRPNVLFAIADDMSHASAYGYKFLQTPNFDKIASQGLLFNNMFTPSSKCSPSRAVVVTGRNPWQIENAANLTPVWPDKFKSFIEVLGENGYQTGFTGKGWGPGMFEKGKKRELTGKEYNKIKNKNVPAAGINKIDYAENFKVFMDQKPKDTPFFFWYGCKEPHRSYQFKSGIKNGKKISDVDFLPTFWGDSEDVKHDILDYAVEVEHYDNHLGKILDHLDRLGELDNTIIIVTSDNGMPFPRYKGHPFDFATRVPFAVTWPKHIVKPGRVVNEFASFTDIAPTIFEITNVKEEGSGMIKIEGKSLLDIFNNQANSSRNNVITGRERNDPSRPNGWGYPVRSIHNKDFVYSYNFHPERWPSGTPDADYRDTDMSPTKKYTKNLPHTSLPYQLCYGKRPQEELYDLKKDPECLHNLASNSKYKKLKNKLHKELFAELKRQEDPRMFENGDVFDSYEGEARTKKYLQLVEWFKTGKRPEKIKKQ
ncbi:arylsulfatase A-like enzyme [Wenyingzhuangia heitensis]|uniref:Arylsulfatase A-like enzyme n=1 Tax=Wenyingzhuangia heitensis TaxID=1487859 RepID=A0ABX0UAQ8_9FLAO|nr:sulfatase [Wenyingzhuangia heitensis]NIJ45912.1 arylsulfatase A-like enzyme [Wenyingzhuangia heitensis]